jgi:hypothetical protein
MGSYKPRSSGNNVFHDTILIVLPDPRKDIINMSTYGMNAEKFKLLVIDAKIPGILLGFHGEGRIYNSRFFYAFWYSVSLLKR